MPKRRLSIFRAKPAHFLWMPILSILFTFKATSQAPPVLQGQVVEADTGLPIEGARVVLDRMPTADPIEGVDSASAFGLFRFEQGEVAPGTYQMTTSHPAYLPDSRPVVIGPAGAQSLQIELQKISGENFFDIYTQVSGVVSGIPLAQRQETLVTLRKFGGASGGNSQLEWQETTDALGSVIFRGMQEGFYDFVITTDGNWEPYTSSRKFFDRPQQANFYLKPVSGDLSVSVMGWNPSTIGMTAITNAYVELTGFDPGDRTAAVVPPRTGITEDGGAVIFTDLPPVDWLLVTRRLGYGTITNRVSSAQIGGAFEVMVEIEDRSLELKLISDDYETPEVFRGLSVSLQGLKNTNTEGFERVLSDAPDENGSPDVRLFEQILPGRYRLFVNGEGSSETLMLQPGFTGDDYVEIHEAGLVTMELRLKTKPAFVYGRLLAADQRVAADAPDTSEAEALGRPLYRRKGAEEIAFIEYEIDPILTPTIRTNIVQTDENGFFVARLKSARYGVLIDELSEYWGSHVNLELVTPDALDRAPAGAPPSEPEPPVGPPSIPSVPNVPAPPSIPEVPSTPVDFSTPQGALALLAAIGVITDLSQVEPGQLTPELLDEDDDPQMLLDAADFLGIALPPDLQSFLAGLAGGSGGETGTETPSPTQPTLPTPNGPGQSQFFAAGQGWPFYQEWPFDGRPPSNGTPSAGEPLMIKAQQYSLDLFVRKQVLSVMNTIGNGWLTSPTQNLITGYSQERAAFVTADFSELAEIDGIASLSSTTTGRLEADILPTSGNVTDFFIFNNVPPGDYSFDIEHNRFDFFGLVAGGNIDPTLPPNSIGIPILPINFSIPTWNPPGILPDRDPSGADEFEPLSSMPPGGFSGFGAVGAVPKDEVFHVTWEIENWVPDPEVIGTELENSQGEYESAPSRSTANGNRPSFIRTAYAGDLVFQNPPRLPVGPYDYWDEFFHRWESVNRSLSHNVFIGGPANNVPDMPASPYPDPDTGAAGGIPVPRTQLIVSVVNEAEPDFKIEGVSVRLRSGSTSFSVNSGTSIAVTDTVTPLEVTGQGWIGLTDFAPLGGGQILRHAFITHDPSIPERELIIKVKRGMNLKGKATIAGIGDTGSETPLPKAEALIRDRFGVILFKTRTARDGTWELGETIELLDDTSMSLYVEIRSPGYKPYRQRFSPNDVEEIDGGFFIVADAALEALPQPEIVSIEFDKADSGLFLPGVSKAGNQNRYTRLQSPGPLNLGWTVVVDATPQQFELVGFDDETGNPGTPEMITVFNLPETVYLVDPKGNTGNPFEAESQFDWVPENVNNIAELRAWLNDILSGAAPNVFYDDALIFTPQGGNQWEAIGVTDIWRMPPGLFRPLIVLVSENGGIITSDPYDALTISPTDSATTTPRLMTGVRLPPWLAFTAELFGSVAAVDRLAGGLKASEDEIVEAAPKGRFQMRPEFEATITEKDGKIDYDYRTAVKWSEGMATPDSGFLKLAANQLGLVFDAELRVGARGSENRLFIEGGAGVSNPEIDVNDYLPKALAGKVEAEGSAEVMAQITLENFITPSDEIFPVQMRLNNQVSGAVQATVRYNMTPILSKIPTVGPVLLSLDKTETLQILGRLQGGIGADVTSRWTTFYPPARGSTSGALNHVFERHQFGGRSPGDALNDNALNLCFNFGVGMDVNIAGGRLGASGTLSIQGENCGLTSLPALQVTANKLTDWPPIERVDGTLTASVEAFLDVWVTRFEKKWEWDLIKMSHQFGTEAVEDIRSIGLASTVFSPESALPSEFDPDAENLVNQLFPAASVATAIGEADSQALAYTDIDPETGAMRFMMALKTGDGTFTEPVTVAQAPGMVSIAIAQKANADWLAAWTELDASSIGKPFPTSRIMVATSANNGSSWSSGVEVTSLIGVAAELRLQSLSDRMGLLFLHTTEGPASVHYKLGLAEERDGEWTVLTQEATDQPVEDLAFAAGNDAGLIAFRNGETQLSTMVWNDGSVGQAIVITEQSGRAFDLNYDDEKGFTLAWSNIDGDVLLSKLQEGSSLWSEPQSIVTATYPSELKVVAQAALESPGLLLAWIDSADVKSVWQALASHEGTLVEGPTNLSQNLSGRHSGLELLTGPSGQTTIISRFDNEGAHLREYQVISAPTDGATGDLRLEIITHSSDGELTIQATGERTGVFALESSTDLETWTEIPNIEIFTLPSTVSFPLNIGNGDSAVFVRGIKK